jgi:hypothetical protein
VKVSTQAGSVLLLVGATGSRRRRRLGIPESTNRNELQKSENLDESGISAMANSPKLEYNCQQVHGSSVVG